MNICILLGRIESEIEFKFIINSKNKSIAYFDLELLNKSIVKVKAYDEKADYIYSKLFKGDLICINGQIESDGSITINELPDICHI